MAAMTTRTAADFVGRRRELDNALELLDDTRLITICGPGGIGKTRFAQELVAGLPDVSIHWSALGDVRRNGRIDEAIALDLGLTTLDEHSALSSTTRVVVLDNCEHVIDDVRRVVQMLLDADVAIRVIATSRIPLDLLDEHLFVLGPLDAASELFELRSPSNGAQTHSCDVVELCQRLDGVPLAIELAAARTRAMSAADILRHLDDGLAVIGSNGASPAMPDRPRHHQRLSDTIGWSNELLDSELRPVFHRLGAFTTEFSGEDAHALVGDLTGSTLATADAIDELVMHSLIARGRPDGSRFSMLETIRAYCRARLAERDQLAATEDRVLDCMAAAADEMYSRGKGTWPIDMILDTIVRFPALRDALESTIDRDVSLDRSARLLRVQFTLALQAQAGDIARLGARFAERWGKTQVEDPELMTLFGEAMGSAATASFTIQDYEQAERFAMLSLGSSGGDDHLGHLMAQWILGRLDRDDSNAPAALEHFVAAETAAQRGGSLAGALQSRVLQAQAIALGGDLPAALRILHEVRTEALGDDLLINAIHAATTEAYLSVETDPAGARQSANAAIALASQLGTPYVVGENLRTLGVIALHHDRLDSAADFLREALSFYVDGTIDDEMWTTIRWVAELAARRGDDESATLLAASADVHGRGIPLVCPPPRPPSPSAAVDQRTALRRASAVVEPPTEAIPQPPDGPRTGTWRAVGDVWEVGIDGRTSTVRGSKGIENLTDLLTRPGTEVSVVDLADIVVEHDTGPVFDATARRAIEDRIRDLQEAVDDAKATNDLGVLAVADEEMEQLIDELSKAHGLGGRDRPQHDAIEKARSTVTARIRAAIKRLYDVDRPLATHLERSISTGRMCEYRPERPVDWAT